LFQSIEELLREASLRNASDLHLAFNTPPIYRVNGMLETAGDQPLTAEEVRDLCYQLLTPRHREVLEERKSVDLAVSFTGAGRFRVNIYYQKGYLTGAIRRLADDIPGLEALGLPPAASHLSDMKMGLVLVTGATGSGKSTTLASLINLINATSRRNIITIEDPIEYVHFNKESLINQRELHTDVPSFPDALRGALRADPDVILVGEMRDLDTIRTAIMAAETGHLVFSTLHSRDATSSITRMIGVFTPEEQMQIRQQLSVSLKAVISQQLLTRADKAGRVLASEFMLVTPAISNLIRLGKQEHIYMSLETGSKLGMQTMEQSLIELYKAGLIDQETALRSAKSPSLIEERLGSREAEKPGAGPGSNAGVKPGARAGTKPGVRPAASPGARTGVNPTVKVLRQGGAR